MTEILLSKEQLEAAWGVGCEDDVYQENVPVFKAQVKQIYEWGKEPCGHPDCQIEKLNRECGIAWAELLEVSK